MLETYDVFNNIMDRLAKTTGDLALERDRNRTLQKGTTCSRPCLIR